MNTNIIQQITNWDKTLEEFELSLKLPVYKAPGEESELEQYLTMGRDELLRLDKENRAAIAYRLQQYAFHVKRTINKNISRTGRLKRLLHSYSAGKLNNYAVGNRYMTYEEKLDCFCNDNEYAGKLSNILTQLYERIDRLKDLDKSLENLSNMMRNLSYSGGNDAKS